MRWFCSADKIYLLRTIRSLSYCLTACLQSSGKFLELKLREVHGICSLHYLMNTVPQTAGRLLRSAEVPAQFQGGTKWHYSKSLSKTFGLPLPETFCKLYICIPTNCTQLIYFINNTLKHMYCLKL